MSAEVASMTCYVQKEEEEPTAPFAESSGKRPPVEGKDDTTGPNSEPFVEEKKITTTRTMLEGEKDPKAGVMGDFSPRNFEASGGSLQTSSPASEESITPPYLQWGESLKALLSDNDGVQLYRQYLEQEQCDNYLDFWLACEGLKNHGQQKDMEKLVNLIYRKYICGSLGSAFSRTTRQVIKEKIENQQTNSQLDLNLFDEAQEEIEQFMSERTYKTFLQSDLYLNYVQSQQRLCGEGDGEQEESPNVSESSSVCGQVSSRFLPTVNENEELQMLDEKGGSGSGSGGALHRSLKNRPRFSQSRRSSYSRRGEQYVGNQFGISKPSTSYHALYAPCISVSVQDSELQSLSSDAHTDDTLSLPDSSVDMYPVNSKKHLRTVQALASRNREKDLSCQGFIPRTTKLGNNPVKPMKPAEFVAIVTEKLEEWQRRQEEQEKIISKMQQLEVNSQGPAAIPTAPEQLPYHQQFASLPEGLLKMPITEERDDQAILDEHVERVWDDFSSPVAAWSPRAHSPDRRRSNATQAATRNTGTHHHHRHRCRDREFTSNLSTDSGTVRDFVCPGTVEQTHYKHHHSGGAKTKSQAKMMSEYVDSSRRGDGGAYRSSKEGLSRRSSNKALDSGGSCVDSGVSLPSSVTPYERVIYWVQENEKYRCSHSESSEKDSSIRHRKSSYSLPGLNVVPNTQVRMKKQPVAYNTSRSGSLERGGPGVWPQPSQPFVQDPSMPMLPPPNTTTQLEEARRRLEDDTKARLSRSKSGMPGKEKMHQEVQKSRTLPTKGNFSFDVAAGGESSKKSSRKLTPASASISPTSVPPTTMATTTESGSCNEYIPIGYYFLEEPVPYLTKFNGKNITLGQFKMLLSKKGKYRYFFKKANDEFGTSVVNEEIVDDNEILPLWEGKVFAQVHAIE